MGGDSRDRYLIDPKDTLDTERNAREKGQEILGFYHSHPDHPAVPSVYDKERAWPWYSYLILTTTSQGVLGARAWRLQEDEMVEDSLHLIKRERIEGG